jgi:hypothetical protein
MIAVSDSNAAATHAREWEQVQQQAESTALKVHVLQFQGGWRAFVTFRKTDFKYVVCMHVLQSLHSHPSHNSIQLSNGHNHSI